MRKPGEIDTNRFWTKNDELDRLAGLPVGGKPADDLAARVARGLGGSDPLKSPAGQKPAESVPVPEQNRDWRIHKKFAELHERHGKPFLRFVGDLLDILLSGTLQTRLVRELLEESFARMRRR
ncbi:MAG TPA: hypothetical protein PKM25_15315, partial [Candidatus Ozemobacteraceae bacterium]|nr:hypothetical protein [Candidatus Ozemobacteraceae bacterium]